MTDKKYTIAIIGGGPAGIAAALEAAKYTKSIILISQEKPGGRALWHSLTPSKVWLHAADKYSQTEDILARLENVKSWQDEIIQKQLADAGVNVALGAAKFVDAHTIQIKSDDDSTQSIVAEKIIIATGSVPIFPEGLKPDGKRIIAPRLLGTLNIIPKSIIIVGGGVTGSEMAYLFNKLGAKVTVVTDMTSLLPRADKEVSDALENILQKRGVSFYKNVRVESVKNESDLVHVTMQDGRELFADFAFIAIGRKADASSLNLENAGVEINSVINVDDYCRTNISSVYAAGDVTGAPMTANRAMVMAKIAAQNALTEKQKSVNEKWIVEAVYTQPEVAQVGEISNNNAKVYRADFSLNLKANIDKKDEGFLKIAVDEKDVIIGASAIGAHAADLIFSAAVAVRAKMTIEEFQQIVPANPTFSDIFSEIKVSRDPG